MHASALHSRSRFPSFRSGTSPSGLRSIVEDNVRHSGPAFLIMACMAGLAAFLIGMVAFVRERFAHLR